MKTHSFWFLLLLLFSGNDTTLRAQPSSEIDLTQNDTARVYFLKALKINEELGNDWGVAGALENLGYIAFRSQDYQQALSFHLRTLVIRERLAQKRDLATSLSNVGSTYIKLKDYSAANRYLSQSLALAKEIGFGYLVYNVYKDLSTLMAEKKDFDRAYKFHELYANTKDSVLNKETTQQLHELQTKYETVEKDKKIALLAKEKEIKGKEIERHATLDKAYVGGLVLVIIVAGLVFYILRQRVYMASKNNEIREADFKRRLNQLEMKALRAQINPHFLFNCLNAINLMIIKEQTENALLYLAKFSRLVDLILENSESPAVTLESEIALLESYLQLEELRLPGRIRYTISIDESISLQSTYLPSMVLQPVVENAIWHGIVHKEKDSLGNISIDVRRQENQLVCTIEDNGVGRERAQQLRDQSVIKSRSIGLKITEERLRLRNHMRQCIQITDLKDTLNQGVGTRVTIHIPIEECCPEVIIKDRYVAAQDGGLQGIREVMAVLFYFLSFTSLYGSTPSQGKMPHQVEENTPIKQELDSLKAILKKTASDAGKIEIYGQLCTTYAGNLGEVAVARLYADSIKLLADKLEDELSVATSNYYYGFVERYEGKNSQALDHFQQHIDYCNLSGDSSRMASTLFQMTVVQQALGNYEESFSISYQAINLYQRTGSAFGMANTFMHLGNLFNRLNNVDKSIAMHHQALAIFDTLEQVLKVKMNKLRVLINLGGLYSTLKHYDKARLFFNQSLALSRLLGSKRTTATSLNNIGNLLNQLGQYDSALVYHLEALAIREHASQKDKILNSLINVGETYRLLGNYSSARQFLLRALSMSKEFQSKPSIREAYNQLSALYLVQQNFKQAYDYHQLYVAMKDSVLNEEIAQQLSHLQTKYETGEKDKRIMLLAKEKEIQKKESERQATLTKTFAAGLVSIILLVALLIYIFRQRLHLIAKNDEAKEADFNQKVSELEMKAWRAQINPNFLFNCLNAIKLMILNGQKENASRYLTKFAKLVRLILENAKASAVTLESEMTLLESYIELEGLRLPGRISYSISIDKSIGTQSTYLPSMLLQPVVENAIWHGIAHRGNESKGNISIDVRQDADQLRCTIEDNGVGRARAQQLHDNSLVNHRALGMKITEERLRLRNRKLSREGLQITDLKDNHNHAVGTRVILHIPITEQND